MKFDDEFECDEDLPETGGLELANKVFLVRLLDLEEGGPKANDKKKRLLVKFSMEYPDRFGVKHSKRYKITGYLLDRWKRCKNFEEVKRKILLLAACADTKSVYSNAVAQDTKPIEEKVKQEPKQAAKKQPSRAATTRPPPSFDPDSPPPLRKVTIAPMASKKQFAPGSPLRFFGNSAHPKKGIVSLCVALLLHNSLAD
jgi:hypothetical protein